MTPIDTRRLLVLCAVIHWAMAAGLIFGMPAVMYLELVTWPAMHEPWISFVCLGTAGAGVGVAAAVVRRADEEMGMAR